MARVVPFGISVVIPAHNRVELLLKAVASVVAPAGAPVEIVVVDDASDTDLRRVVPLRNSSGVEIRMVVLNRNAGPQSARNIGMRRSAYRYVAFLDSDDRFMPEKIGVLLDILARNDLDMLYHGVIGMEKYADLSRRWRRVSSLVSFPWLLALCNPVATPALVIRNDRRLGVPGMRYCEDYAFLLHYVRPGTRVDYLDSMLSSVDRRQGSKGGLSEATWRMRKGEFRARQVLLRDLSPGSLARWLLGGAMGCLRILNDLARGRYFGRSGSSEGSLDG